MRKLFKIATKRNVNRVSSFIIVLTLVFTDVFVLLDYGLSRAPIASAATGDFSIFREAGGGSQVTNSGFNVTWDTAVTESPNISLEANDSEIDLSEGGKYLVLYNVFTEEGSFGGNNRRTVSSYLTLGGSPIPYGRGSGYIRDAENDLTAYNSGAAIIDAGAGDNLRLVVVRDENNAAAGTGIRGASNGISVLKLDEDLDYLRVYKSTRSSDISGNTLFTDVTWDTSEEVDASSFAFVPTSADVTLKGGEDQLFLVTANVKLNVDGLNGPRQNYEMRLTLDGAEIPGTRTNSYLRFDEGTINGTLQYVGIVKKTSASDQTFNVEVRREGPESAATDIVGNETALSMMALPSGAEVISLTHGVDQPLTSTQSVMNWDTQIQTSSKFIHSTTTTNDNIEIASDGDYIFFSSAYNSRSFGGGRDVPRLDWRLDGAVLPYGGHGSFNRGDQSTDDAFTSGSAGGTIMSGLTSGQIIELIQSDESTGTPVTNFISNRVALQAIDISSMLSLSSTEVSINGSQPATTTSAVSDFLLGEQIVVIENDTSRNLTNITLSENGTIDAVTSLSNTKIYYDLDTTFPYDCSSENYGGGESQFGSTGTFSGSDGTANFSSSVVISPTQAFCGYVVLDIGSEAVDGDTLNIFIDNPSNDVVITGGGTINPSTSVGNSFTTIEDAEVTQANYHWRNDDGSESGATSATDGIENTPGLSFSTSTPQRLRLGVHAEGTGSQATSFLLEYGEKVTTCDAVSTWSDVGASGGAWDMFDSVNIFEGANTTNISIANGGVSDGTGSFVSPNGGVRDATSQTGVISVTANDFIELEYSIIATNEAVEGVGYCFRVVNAASEAPFLSGYESRVPFSVPASNIDSVLTDFPVYVDLSDLGAEFWAGVASDGRDIRVTTNDAVTEVPFELVSIDTGAETGELHFKAPTLSDSVDNSFFIYFDNPAASAYAATDTYGRNNVWTNGFEAVYHLPTTVDSTGNGNTLTASNITNSGTTKVGTQAADFNGSNSVYTFSSAAAIVNGHSAVTFSGWIDSDVISTDKGFLATEAINGSDSPFCMRYDVAGFSGGGSNVIKGCIDATGGVSSYETASGVQTTDWQHVTQTWQSGQALDMYIDAVETVYTAAPPTVSGTTDVGSGPLYIGAGPKDSASGGWDGRLDEVRFASAFRTQSWVQAAYRNQNNPTSFYTVGAFQNPDSVIGSIGYDVYPEATLSTDVSVSALGSQFTTVNAGADDVYIGGQFVITSNAGSRTVTAITLTETGTIDAAAYLSNPRVAVDFDTSAPYDCASESYGGGEPVLSGGTFSSANGSTTITGSGLITQTRALCAYVLVDVSSTTGNGETIKFEISSPNTDVAVLGATVGPGSVVELTGSTSVNAAALVQTGYHWRNNDGDEAGATSATGGNQNTTIVDVAQQSIQRIRIAVSNEGDLTSSNTNLRLEYGIKLTTCGGIGSWERVDTGVAFAMASSSQLVDGNNTSNIAVGIGGVTDPNTTFLTPNGGQKEDDDEVASTLSIATTEFVEVEFAIRSTKEAAFSTSYCFRVTDDGVPIAGYDNYPELVTAERQDFIIQRGTETVSGTGVTLVAGVDYVQPESASRAFIRITNTSMTGAGSDTLGATRVARDLTAYIQNPDNIMDSITIARPAGATDNTRVSWEIIEYVGITGADNELVVRDVGTVTYGVSNVFATGTAVSGVSDDSDVVVFITGQLNPATSNNDYNTGLSISSWSATTDQPVFERGDADGIAAGVSYAVVEFSGVNWKTQRVEHTFVAAGVTETESITTVNSLARTFIQAQKISGDELVNLDESGHEVWLSSIGAVSFRLENGSTNPADQKSAAWIIENTQVDDGAMAVYRSNGQIDSTSGQPNTYLFSIGATIKSANASIWANNRSTGPGSAHPRALLGARIVNDTQYELWKSDEGQNQNFRVEIVDWPVAETSIRQTHYRLYVDNDSVEPTDPWSPGVVDLGENEAMTDLDEPLGAGERTRIRVALFINNASLVAGSQSFKLQYSRRLTTCSAASVWDDVGQPGSGEIWRGYDASPADGTEVSSGSLLISVSDVAGSYEESNPSIPNPNTIDIGEYVEYDWLIENNGALQKSSYCFRMVENNGSEINGYNVYPTIRTSGYTPVINNWRWYNDETNITPTSPLAGERIAPSDVSLYEELKLRVSVTEIEGAPGDNIKFNLQYSEYSDFSDGGTTLTPTSTCSGNSIWCYADGAGENNDTIETAVLSGVAACSGGVGIGCGTVNEAEGLFGTYDQPAFSTAEHEFTLRHDGARVNAVYYFRLVDATNGVNLVASTSYPSLVTEGASLTFQVSGVDRDVTVEGVVTDATSTATSIDFGSLPIDTDVEVAQRLTVLTNGTQGYQVYMQFDQELLNSYGEVIPSITSTNAAPATWESVCTGVATGCFGYHAGDNVLYDSSLRFSLDNRYAGVESGPVEVMASNVPVQTDESEIVYRTRVTRLQPAGDYTTNIQYIAVPIF